MSIVEKTFPAAADKILFLFPDQRYGLGLDDWDELSVEALEQDSPNFGRYNATLNDQYRFWMVFEGSSQPTDWDQYIDIIDLADDVLEIQSGITRLKQSALAQVVRWVAGPVVPNEPYPPIRRLGTRDLTLFNGEDLPAIIPLEALDEETLSAIEGQELRFVVETSRKVVLDSQLLTVENGSIEVPSTAALTTKKQNLQWSLRWPETNGYLTGGRITVAYAPIDAS